MVILVVLALLFSGFVPGFNLRSALGGKGSTPKYLVTFTESGLPDGTLWSVTLGGNLVGSTSTTISFSEASGSYPYAVTGVAGYGASPKSGTAVVSGANLPVGISFTPVTYSVTFTESGLPTGTSWSVTLGGDLEESTTAEIVYSEPNGSYGFSLGSVSGYSPDPPSGTVNVEGAAASEPIEFESMSYELGMTEYSASGSASTWYDWLSISPTVGLNTSIFGLKVTTPGSATYPTVAANGTGCSVSTTTNLPTSCKGTPGGWYGVLVSAVGYILAIYGGATAGWTYPSGVTSVALTNADSLLIVTSVQVSGNGYTISAYGTGSSSVTGSTSL